MIRNIIFLLAFICGFSTYGQINNSNKSAKKTIRQVYKFLENEDLDGLNKLIAKDFKFSDPSANVQFQGKEQTSNYLTSVFKIQSELRVGIKRLYNLAENIVVVKGVWKGTLNGKSVKADFLTVFVLNGQQMIKSQTDHFNLQDLLN